MLFDILEQILLYLPLMFGIMFSYRILKLTDLTVDGSFVLGAATYARCIVENIPIPISLLFAVIIGAFAGLIVGSLQINQRMSSLMASILTLFMLYSVNFKIMGQPNINLLNSPTIYTLANNINIPTVILMLIYNLLIFTGFYLLLNTRPGLIFRALGDNPAALKKIGYSVNKLQCFGLMLSNSLAAFCGATVAQINGFADLHMGVGIALIGIGAVVIGSEFLRYIKSISIKFNYLFCSLIGAGIYFSLLTLLLSYGIEPINVKLLMGLLLTMILTKKNLKEHPCQ